MGFKNREAHSPPPPPPFPPSLSPCLPRVLLVVLLHERPARDNHLKGNQCPTLALEARHDFPNQTSLKPVWLHRLRAEHMHSAAVVKSSIERHWPAVGRGGAIRTAHAGEGDPVGKHPGDSLPTLDKTDERLMCTSTYFNLKLGSRLPLFLDAVTFPMLREHRRDVRHASWLEINILAYDLSCYSLL